jgi:transposase-like protein
VEAIGTSKSAVSRRLIKGLERALEELLNRSLSGLDLLALMIDGVVVAEHTAVVALGIDGDGHKHVLGLWEGATENAALCRSLLSYLVARGLRYEQGILVVIDGSKALRAAVREVFGNKAVVQRCQVHKKRNVLEHLPKNKQARVKRRLNAAWRENNPTKAKQKLLRLAEELEKDHPGAAASLREGLEETLTVQRLRLPELLQKSLSSTNIVESALDGVRQTGRNVKRWSDGKQVLRWVAAGLLVAESRFHRLAGYRELPLLRVALQREMLLRKGGEITPAYATA